MAVQVDPMKLKLKPPVTKRLKLKCDMLLSASAFKFNLRRYNQVWADFNAQAHKAANKHLDKDMKPKP